MSDFITLTGVRHGIGEDDLDFWPIWVRRASVVAYGEAKYETAAPALVKSDLVRSFVRTTDEGIFIVTESISQIADLLSEPKEAA